MGTCSSGIIYSLFDQYKFHCDRVEVLDYVTVYYNIEFHRSIDLNKEESIHYFRPYNMLLVDIDNIAVLIDGRWICSMKMIKGKLRWSNKFLFDAPEFEKIIDVAISKYGPTELLLANHQLKKHIPKVSAGLCVH